MSGNRRKLLSQYELTQLKMYGPMTAEKLAARAQFMAWETVRRLRGVFNFSEETLWKIFHVLWIGAGLYAILKYFEPELKWYFL